jgi:hypothetical protein
MRYGTWGRGAVGTGERMEPKRGEIYVGSGEGAGRAGARWDACCMAAAAPAGGGGVYYYTHTHTHTHTHTINTGKRRRCDLDSAATGQARPTTHRVICISRLSSPSGPPALVSSSGRRRSSLSPPPRPRASCHTCTHEHPSRRASPLVTSPRVAAGHVAARRPDRTGSTILGLPSGATGGRSATHAHVHHALEVHAAAVRSVARVCRTRLSHASVARHLLFSAIREGKKTI